MNVMITFDDDYAIYVEANNQPNSCSSPSYNNGGGDEIKCSSSDHNNIIIIIRKLYPMSLAERWGISRVWRRIKKPIIVHKNPKLEEKVVDCRELAYKHCIQYHCYGCWEYTMCYIHQLKKCRKENPFSP